MKLSDRELDELLAMDETRPPDDFVARVMAKVSAASERGPRRLPAASGPRLVKSGPARRRTRRGRAETTRHTLVRSLRWCLIGVGGALGVAQSVAFCLGAWLVTAAG